MSINLFLSSAKIIQKEFEGTKPGYDSLQVDSFLDIVAKDYDEMNRYIKDSEEELRRLKAQLDMLSKQLSECEVKVALYEKRIENYEKSSINVENIDLLQKIAKLEKALAKLGVNPEMIQ